MTNGELEKQVTFLTKVFAFIQSGAGVVMLIVGLTLWLGNIQWEVRQISKTTGDHVNLGSHTLSGERLTRLETDYPHLKDDIGEIKDSIKDIQNDIKQLVRNKD